MTQRALAVIQTLLICLLASTLGALIKIGYGAATHTLAFIADGIHSVFDSTSTVLGILSALWASKPPDESHPYGHQKMETFAAIILAMLLLFAAYHVGYTAYERIMGPAVLPTFSFFGVVILIVIMGINLAIARFEAKKAKELKSPFLLSDSAHNQSDFLISGSVLISLIAARFHIQYIDGIISFIIALYLIYLSFRLLVMNIRPLMDSSVLPTGEIKEIVTTVPGVTHCHAVRSRGDSLNYFVDLRIHLPDKTTLKEAHAITHQVESRLKERFPGLIDVVIHTEPDSHRAGGREE